MTLWFVCTGAINRSPAALTIWESFSTGLEAGALAISPTNRGKKMTRRMRDALASLNFIPDPDYRSRWIGGISFEDGDSVWVMQPSHLKHMKKFHPSIPSESLASLCSLPRVPDPHFDSAPGAHLSVVRHLKTALERLRVRLNV